MQVLKTTGMLAIKVPQLKPRLYDTLHWGVRPPDNMPGDVTWYIDGSMVNPKRLALATAGFALAAVGRDGKLWAWAWGAPPEWCDSASAAEAWALATLLKTQAQMPWVITDCLGLLKTAETGAVAATGSRK